MWGPSPRGNCDCIPRSAPHRLLRCCIRHGFHYCAATLFLPFRVYLCIIYSAGAHLTDTLRSHCFGGGQWARRCGRSRRSPSWTAEGEPTERTEQTLASAERSEPQRDWPRAVTLGRLHRLHWPALASLLSASLCLSLDIGFAHAEPIQLAQPLASPPLRQRLVRRLAGSAPEASSALVLAVVVAVVVARLHGHRPRGPEPIIAPGSTAPPRDYARRSQLPIAQIAPARHTKKRRSNESSGARSARRVGMLQSLMAEATAPPNQRRVCSALSGREEVRRGVRAGPGRPRALETLAGAYASAEAALSKHARSDESRLGLVVITAALSKL